jgi:hypothetical protein
VIFGALINGNTGVVLHGGCSGCGADNRDRASWTPDDLAQTLNFIIGHEPNLFQSIDPLVLNDGSSRSIGEANANEGRTHGYVVHFLRGCFGR